MKEITDLYSKIEELESKIEFGEKLESIIDDERANQSVKLILSDLNTFLEAYQKEAKQTEKVQILKEKAKKDRESWLEQYAKVFNTREEAERYYDEPIKNPKKAAIQFSITAFLYGNLAWLSAPFSREVSKKFLKSRMQYLELKKIYNRLYSVENESKIKRIQNFHLKEMKEAKLAEKLRKRGGDDEVIYQVLNKPEIMLYALLDSLRDKYAPWV